MKILNTCMKINNTCMKIHNKYKYETTFGQNVWKTIRIMK